MKQNWYFEVECCCKRDQIHLPLGLSLGDGWMRILLLAAVQT
jgi:hypothetical protein